MIISDDAESESQRNDFRQDRRESQTPVIAFIQLFPGPQNKLMKRKGSKNKQNQNSEAR